MIIFLFIMISIYPRMCGTNDPVEVSDHEARVGTQQRGRSVQCAAGPIPEPWAPAVVRQLWRARCDVPVVTCQLWRASCAKKPGTMSANSTRAQPHQLPLLSAALEWAPSDWQLSCKNCWIQSHCHPLKQFPTEQQTVYAVLSGEK